MPDLRINWLSNSPNAATGYANQTRIFTPRIRDLGYPLCISAFYGVEGGSWDWNGIPLFPKGYDGYGNDIIPTHSARFFGGDPKAGLLLTLLDVWVLQPAALQMVNAAHWLPIDHDPVPPLVVKTLREGQGYPIAFSRFGLQKLREAGFPETLYVPHGAETQTFRPLDRPAVRARLGMDADWFIVGMVAANKGSAGHDRKSFGEAFDAFGQFLRSRQPTDPKCLLYVHSEVQGIYSGHNLPDLARGAGIPPDNIAYANQYEYLMGYPDEAMATLYNAFDVLLAPSQGEGFGIPILESQSCGTPVIVTDFSAMSELCGVGWKVGGQRRWTGQRSWQMVPDVAQVTEALELAYQSRHDRAAREHAAEWAQQYDADRVTREHWVPALEQLETWVKSRNRKAAYSPEFAAQAKALTEVKPPAPPPARSPFLDANPEPMEVGE